MNTIDIIIVVCFLPALYFGIKNGLVIQVVSFCVIYFGIKLSLLFSNPVTEWLDHSLGVQGFWAKFISFFLIFLAVAVILSLLGNIVERIVKVTLLGWVNRLLGVILSFLICAVILASIAYFLNKINGSTGLIDSSNFSSSKFYPLLLEMGQTIFSNF